MKKISFLLAIVSAFLFTGQAFAVAPTVSNYARSPTGNTPYSPVTITGTGNCSYGWCAIWLRNGTSYLFRSDCFASGAPFNVSFSTSSNLSVIPWIVDYGDAECGASHEPAIASNDPFTIISAPPAPPARPTWGTIEPEQITEVLDNTGAIFYDLWFFVALFLGIPLAFWIIWKMTKIMPKENKKDDRPTGDDSLDIIIENKLAVKTMERARLNYEAGKLDQRHYEEVLEKYSKK